MSLILAFRFSSYDLHSRTLVSQTITGIRYYPWRVFGFMVRASVCDRLSVVYRIHTCLFYYQPGPAWRQWELCCDTELRNLSVKINYPEFFYLIRYKRINRGWVWPPNNYLSITHLKMSRIILFFHICGLGNFGTWYFNLRIFAYSSNDLDSSLDLQSDCLWGSQVLP